MYRFDNGFKSFVINKDTYEGNLQKCVCSQQMARIEAKYTVLHIMGYAEVLL